MNFDFKCNNCGKNELYYEEWVKSKKPVILHDDYIEYELLEIDENDTLGFEYGYVCSNCNTRLAYLGYPIQNEKDLIDYLSLDPIEKEENEKMYQETLDEEAFQRENIQDEIDECALSSNDNDIDFDELDIKECIKGKYQFISNI